MEKIELCVLKLKDYFKDMESTSSVIPIPKEIILHNDEWLYFIMYSCLLNYGVKSKIYNENILNTYRDYEWMFNPKEVINHSEEDILKIVRESIHHRYPNIATKKWRNLSYALCKIENIFNVITEFNSYIELYEFIASLGGYGQKTGGLLLRIIYEAGICKYEDSLPIIPLDRHDIEISYLCGITDKKKLSNKEIYELSRMWIETALKYEVSANLIDQYLWHVGAELCNKKKCLECPLYSECKNKLNEDKL